MKRILAIDYGLKHTGLAISDELHITTRPLEVLTHTSAEECLELLLPILHNYQLEVVVVGLPVSLNRTLGPQVKKVQEFVTLLQSHTNIPVVLVDETLTSYEADAIQKEQNTNNRNDALAAQIILETYIQHKD